jgi:hypothetical protein
MKLQDWIQIALVIATVLLAAATVVGPILAARISRSDQTSHTPIWWFKHVVVSPWVFPPLLILYYFVRLVVELHETGPVTRRVVFGIAFYSAGVLWGAVCMVICLMGQLLSGILEVQGDTIRSLRDLGRLQAEIDRDILETLKETVPRETIRRVLNIMESMTTELERVRQKSERRTGISGLFGR